MKLRISCVSVKIKFKVNIFFLISVVSSDHSARTKLSIIYDTPCSEFTFPVFLQAASAIISIMNFSLKKKDPKPSAFSVL